MSMVSTAGILVSPPRPNRILVVEDDSRARWVLCAILKQMGFECTSAGDGREAIDAVAADAPDLILMDLMMPVLDGLEATRRLKADATTRSIPIVALTADDTPSGRFDAQQAGCDDFVPKPVVMDDLIGRIRRNLSTLISKHAK